MTSPELDEGFFLFCLSVGCLLIRNTARRKDKKIHQKFFSHKGNVIATERHVVDTPCGFIVVVKVNQNAMAYHLQTSRDPEKTVTLRRYE